MFDIAPSELLLVAIVALVVIGPKDLPKALRVVGYWVGKARGVARQFRSGFDEMVREAELEEMEKRWAKENERIMRDHPQPAADQPAIEHVSVNTAATDDQSVMTPLPATELPTSDVTTVDDQPVVHVEKPVVVPASNGESDRPPNAGVSS